MEFQKITLYMTRKSPKENFTEDSIEDSNKFNIR